MKRAFSDLALTSPDFAHGERIPRRHVQEGANENPGLVWSDAPEGTESYAIVCYDPDAPIISSNGFGYVHWVTYNIPGSVTELSRAQAPGFTLGVNLHGEPAAYAGPKPPPGHGEHRYYFMIMALGPGAGDLPAGLSMQELCAHAEPYVLGTSRLVGIYSAQ